MKMTDEWNYSYISLFSMHLTFSFFFFKFILSDLLLLLYFVTELSSEESCLSNLKKKIDDFFPSRL